MLLNLSLFVIDNQRVSTQLPSRRLPVECDFSPDELLEARFRARNLPNLREGEQLPHNGNC